MFEPGHAVQRVKTRINGHRVKACTGEKRIDRAGKLTVRCRISAGVRRHLRSGPLRLSVRVGFVGSYRGSFFTTRHLTLPPLP